MPNNPRAIENLRFDGNPGHRPGIRPPDKLKQFFVDLVNHPKTQKFLSDLVKGEAVEEKILDAPDGSPMQVKVSAPTKVRLEAIRECIDRAIGKAVQPTEIVHLDFIFNFTQKVVSAINRTLGDKCPHCGGQLPFRDNTIKELEILAEAEKMPVRKAA